MACAGLKCAARASRKDGSGGEKYREVGFLNINWQAGIANGSDRAPICGRACSTREPAKFNDGKIDMYRLKLRSVVKNPGFRIQTDKHDDGMTMTFSGGARVETPGGSALRHRVAVCPECVPGVGARTGCPECVPHAWVPEWVFGVCASCVCPSVCRERVPISLPLQFWPNCHRQFSCPAKCSSVFGRVRKLASSGQDQIGPNSVARPSCRVPSCDGDFLGEAETGREREEPRMRPTGRFPEHVV